MCAVGLRRTSAPFLRRCLGLQEVAKLQMELTLQYAQPLIPIGVRCRMDAPSAEGGWAAKMSSPSGALAALAGGGAGSAAAVAMAMGNPESLLPHTSAEPAAEAMEGEAKAGEVRVGALSRARAAGGRGALTALLIQLCRSTPWIVSSCRKKRRTIGASPARLAGTRVWCNLRPQVLPAAPVPILCSEHRARCHCWSHAASVSELSCMAIDVNVASQNRSNSSSISCCCETPVSHARSRKHRTRARVLLLLSILDYWTCAAASSMLRKRPPGFTRNLSGVSNSASSPRSRTRMRSLSMIVCNR